MQEGDLRVSWVWGGKICVCDGMCGSVLYEGGGGGGGWLR